jgi:Predicted integral membrane protein
MRSFISNLLAVITLTLSISISSASIALPGLQATSLASLSQRPCYGEDATTTTTHRHSRRHHRSILSHNHLPAAMAIPGYGVTEQIFVGGFANFLQIYNLVITARVLLSWFPQAQGIGALQPVYAITDPYLNLFRGIIPPIFGLDLSPILAFFTLNVLTNATAAVGREGPEDMMDSSVVVNRIKCGSNGMNKDKKSWMQKRVALLGGKNMSFAM